MPRDQAIDPLMQLERCHRRLEEACDALGPATETEDRKATIEDVAAFLERQIRRHEDDEESSLFPRLASKPELADDLAKLTKEHAHHDELRRRFRDASATLDGPKPNWPELCQVADELVRSYRDHIALEETRLFPAARAALSPEDLAAMRTEMDARRGR